MVKMKKEIIINSSIGETRIAILENKHLIELFVEQPQHERMVGDIYLGRVVLCTSSVVYRRVMRSSSVGDML